jgi:hypothetical protein
MTQASKPHVFVSYLREDQPQVEKLCRVLTDNDVAVWLDRQSVRPGERWQVAISRAIKEGAFFIACFSGAYGIRETSYMNVELTIAIEQLRTRPTDRAWFIPLLFEGGMVPDRPIGGGETLRDIQWVDFSEDWDDGIRRILSVLRPPELARRSAESIPQERIVLSADLIGFSSRLGDADFLRILADLNRSQIDIVAKHGGQMATLSAMECWQRSNRPLAARGVRS